MQSDIKPSRCTAKQQFAKSEQRNIIDVLQASITTDSIKIFSITFCTLVTVYCTCKIAKDAFRIVLYDTTFYMQHCAVACFVLRANRASQEAPAHNLPVGTWINTLQVGYPCLLHNAKLYTTLFKIYANSLGTFLRKMGKSEEGKELNTGFSTEVKCSGLTTVLKTDSFQ